MAGEWIMRDIALAKKPEVQELVDITGEIVEVVCFRLEEMWGWSSLNTADGTVRMTPERLARMHGGTAAFWLAVEAVGWLRFDGAAGTMTVTGWESRFSKAAKARAADRMRKINERQRDSGECPDSVRGLSGDFRTDSGLEERTGHLPPPPPPRAREGAGQAAGILEAWNRAADKTGRLARHESVDLPAAIWDRLADPAWATEAVKAIERLTRCDYFDSALPFSQFCGCDRKGVSFVSRVLGGEYDGAKRSKGSGAAAMPDGRPTAAEAAKRWQRGVAESARRVAEYKKQQKEARA